MMREYGAPPIEIDTFDIRCVETMAYLYLPIKIPQGTYIMPLEPRLKLFMPLIEATARHVIARGDDTWAKSYVYLSAKRLYQGPRSTFNRPGWHIDGFGTDDLNYIWCDTTPTEFSVGSFDLSEDDSKSMAEMEEQSHDNALVVGRSKTLYMLDNKVVHRVADPVDYGMRTFVKISISTDRYDLEGNSINDINMGWNMYSREHSRNTPQKIVQG